MPHLPDMIHLPNIPHDPVEKFIGVMIPSDSTHFMHGTSHLGASHTNHGDNVNGSIGVNDDNGNHAGIHGDTDLHGHSHGGIDFTHNDGNGSISVSADTDFHGGNNVSAGIGYNW
mgnify:CR=1 FL=1